jgi:hypothetical protein
MRRPTLCAVASLALCFCLGAGVASASAALPEIGRCVKVEGVKEGKKTHYHGAYATSKCDKPKPGHVGKYEWMPGLGPRTGFTGSGTGVILVEETPDPATVTKCGGSASEGRLTSATGLAIQITYTSCERSEDACIEQPGSSHEEPPECVPPCEEGQVSEPPRRECEEWTSCQSEGAAAGEIRTLPMEGQLSFIAEGPKPKVAITLNTAEKGPIATYECGGLQAAFGGMTGEVVPVDKMSLQSRLAFRGFGNGSEVTDTFEEPVEVRGLE